MDGLRLRHLLLFLWLAVYFYVTTELWVNKGVTNEHLTRYSYNRGDETQLVNKYILRDLAGKGAQDLDC